jgi:hypothetical protein
LARPCLAHPGPAVSDVLDTVGERRFVIALVIIGVVASGYVLYAARVAWRRAAEHRARNRRRPDVPVYSGSPAAGAIALGLGAFQAVAAGEPVDDVAYRRSPQQVRAELAGILGESARESLPRALRALLGGDAENVAPGIALAEEALRQRTRVGPELWQHSLDSFATAQSLPFGERQSLLALAADITRAEDRLRQERLLGPDELVPTLLASHWAEGVHLVRCGLRADWLPPTQGLEYLARADELTRAWYPSWSTVIGALALPALLNEDVQSTRWQFRVAHQLITDHRSPLTTPLPTR